MNYANNFNISLTKTQSQYLSMTFIVITHIWNYVRRKYIWNIKVGILRVLPKGEGSKLSWNSHSKHWGLRFETFNFFIFSNDKDLPHDLEFLHSWNSRFDIFNGSVHYFIHDHTLMLCNFRVNQDFMLKFSKWRSHYFFIPGNFYCRRWKIHGSG